MHKCNVCKSDTIYLGKSFNSIISYAIGPVYNYVCADCGAVEWSSEREKSKYKWYKYDKDKLKKLLEGTVIYK